MIAEDGEQLGIMKIEEAQRLAATLLSQTDLFRTRKESVQDNA